MRNRLQRRNVGRNGHYYLFDGAYVPGVTTVLGKLDKPWMKPWVSNLIADYVADNRDWLATAPDPDAIRSVLKAVPNNITRDALARGTELHTHAETLLRDGEIDMPPGEQADMVQAIADFLTTWHIERIAIEIPLCNTQKRWAGTTDLICRSRPLAQALNLPDDALIIIDWKTNAKAIYAESAIQVATYANADLAHINGEEQPMPRIDGAALVRATPTGCELVPVWPRRIPDLYRLFTAALYVWQCTDDKRGWLNTALADPASTPDDLHTTLTQDNAA